MAKPKLLTQAQLEEIRADVRDGVHGPIMLKWIQLLLEDHDERVRLERERQSPQRVRDRYGRRHDEMPLQTESELD
jgi:hypothetical protein